MADFDLDKTLKSLGGTGTLIGAAVGGGLLLWLGGGFNLQGLLLGALGAIGGALTGGFFNKEGPVFGPGGLANPAPQYLSRKLGMDTVPELDASGKPQEMLVQFDKGDIKPGATGIKFLMRVKETEDKQHLETSEILQLSADGPPKSRMKLDPPISADIVDGKVDYKEILGRVGLRFSEHKGDITQVPLSYSIGLVNNADIQLTDEMKNALQEMIAKWPGDNKEALQKMLNDGSYSKEGKLAPAFITALTEGMKLPQDGVVLTVAQGDNIYWVVGEPVSGENKIHATLVLTQDIKTKKFDIGASKIGIDIPAKDGYVESSPITVQAITGAVKGWIKPSDPSDDHSQANDPHMKQLTELFNQEKDTPLERKDNNHLPLQASIAQPAASRA